MNDVFFGHLALTVLAVSGLLGVAASCIRTQVHFEQFLVLALLATGLLVSSLIAAHFLVVFAAAYSILLAVGAVKAWKLLF